MAILCQVIGPDDLDVQVSFEFPPLTGDEVQITEKVFKVLRRRWVLGQEPSLIFTVE
jgi:hypothetical protein